MLHNWYTLYTRENGSLPLLGILILSHPHRRPSPLSYFWSKDRKFAYDCLVSLRSWADAGGAESPCRRQSFAGDRSRGAKEYAFA